MLAYLFDEAVWYFGAWVDGKLTETKKDGKPKYNLADLLSSKAKARKVSKAEFESLFGSDLGGSEGS